MSGTTSILTDDLEHCLICGSPYVEIHHCIYGTANRKIADKYGLVIALCREHHTGPHGVHFDPVLSMDIKKVTQKMFESKYNHDKWIELVGRNYL